MTDSITSIEVDVSEQFKPLEPEELKRFFRVGRTQARKAANRLLKAIQKNAPRGQDPDWKSGLWKSFATRVKTKKREGLIEARVQPRGPYRASRKNQKAYLQSWQWLKAFWLEYGTKYIRARYFIRRSQMEQQAAMDRDLDEIRTAD